MICGLPVPGPKESFTTRKVTTQEVPLWYHVYCTESHLSTKADTFSQGWGDTRFAPIMRADGTPYHTYYMASSTECAYMESVLHDVSLAPPGVFEVARLRHFHLATLTLKYEIHAVSLHTKDLPRLGLKRCQLIDSLPACYPETRAWAQAAFVQRPTAQALAYGSRRDDSARCLMLAKDARAAAAFEVVADESLALEPRRAEVLALIRSLKICEI
jgi:hypothetical protein